MRKLWLHSRPESQTLGLGPNKWYFRSLPQDSQAHVRVRRAPPQGLLVPLSFGQASLTVGCSAIRQQRSCASPGQRDCGAVRGNAEAATSLPCVNCTEQFCFRLHPELWT